MNKDYMMQSSNLVADGHIENGEGEGGEDAVGDHDHVDLNEMR